MVDFLDEVEQDLSQENFYNLVRKIFPYFVAFSLIIVAVSSYYAWSNARIIKSQELLSEELMSANEFFQRNKLDEALKSYLNLLDKKNDNYSAIAGFKAASVYLKQNKINEAMLVYEKIAKTPAFALIFRDQANLLFISYSFKKENDNSKLLDALDQIIHADSPYKYNAMELKASMLMDLDKLDEAKNIFIELSTNSSVPSTIQKNSQAIISINWKNYEKN